MRTYFRSTHILDFDTNWTILLNMASSRLQRTVPTAQLQTLILTMPPMDACPCIRYFWFSELALDNTWNIILIADNLYLDSAHPTYVVYKALGEDIVQQLMKASQC